jgi:murein DD-endopeptidase MepM/ murein hydrolase activator NlpD
MKPFLALLAVFVLCTPVIMANEEPNHVIQRGETLYSISRQYNVSVEDLMETNGITDPTTVRAGTRLRIPSRYTVKPGDTLYGIARRHDTTVERIIELNTITDATALHIGTVLRLPGTGQGTESDTAAATRPASDETGRAGGESVDRTAGRTVIPDPGRLLPDVASRREPGGESSTSWPHPGRRFELDGKFPGIMIEGRAGDQVVSVASGRVVYAGPHSGFGRVVFVQTRSGYIYVYGGNEEIFVRLGDMVESGTAIGRIGRNGTGAESRVYFSVWKNNTFIDPETAPRG